MREGATSKAAFFKALIKACKFGVCGAFTVLLISIQPGVNEAAWISFIHKIIELMDGYVRKLCFGLLQLKSETATGNKNLQIVLAPGNKS